MQPRKKITTEVSNAVWKELKVLAVQKEISLQMVVAELLERSMQKKVKANSSNEDTE
jgi:predicted DNA-binding ribbon-helix-helix protein